MIPAFIVKMIVFGWIASLAAADSAPVAGQQALADASDDGDEGASWIFSPAPYSEDPQTGKRVWKYAKEKTVYTNQPRNSSMYEPRYSTSDPFFLPTTDKLFFMNTPDPFYAEPTAYPPDGSSDIGSDRYFSGLDTGVQ
jgi:hypothetical protein